MSEVDDFKIMEWIVESVNNGDLIHNQDGTYSLSKKLHDIAQKMINEKPELYAQIFPDRIN